MPEGEYKAEEVESKWQKTWVDNNTYRYNQVDEDAEVFSIDTPPPTVSGSLHMGHLYQFTLQDFVARFHRMKDDEVFFPFGYDDNGIASERLTERELGIEHQNFTRREFQEKCREVCKEYEEDFTNKMRQLGFSMDWNSTYKTIEPRVQRISQLSFIDLYEKDREYREKAPTIWCPDCQTAISQVETEDDEKSSHFNDIEFELVSGGSLMISTTRPELLPACVAVIVHPEDENNTHLVGEKAEVPLFGHEVPIIEDERVDMEKGSGIVMCCTFGDQTDIEWYQAHDLDLRVAIDESGTMTDLAEKYEGMNTEEAREAIVEDLDNNGNLLDRRAIEHTVQVHERCGTGIEFQVSPQWYVKVLDKKKKYLKAGKSMEWFPEKMYTRYKHWIEGLQWDWCISRQRDSGIPFPVWYCEECGEEILAEKEDLPVDPLQDKPPVEECPECGHHKFNPEEDVFDTWATSSLTPLINSGWDWNSKEKEFEMERPELYQFSMRPQGHDIISFWLFHTVVKCMEHTGEVPFESAMINGMVLDENRLKMSKSKGNVVTPEEVLEDHPVDAARYWAAGTSIGDDFPFKDKDLVAGEKLMRKIWNASKLVEHLIESEIISIDGEEMDEIDRYMMAKLDDLTEEVTQHFEEREFSKARNKLRHQFWNIFCDNYLEIAKQKMEDQQSESTEYVLQHSHQTFLKMFAPFLSHITEELYRDMYSSKSIHNSDWPSTTGIDSDVEKGDAAMETITAIRKYKSENQMSPTAEVESIKVFSDISGFEDEVKQVMHVQNLEIVDEEPEMETMIKEIKLDYEKAGPKYGNKIGEIEAALSQNKWALDDGHLRVADEMLKPEMFNVIEEREYTGEGTLVESNDVAVVVK